MSGVEVAGLVLGAIPLVISALEHYGEGVSVMKNMRDFECVFDDVQTQFAASVGIYMDSCYSLLGPLNLTDEAMNELLDQRKKEAWSDPKLKSAIETRLGANYKVYIALMEKLNKRILLFCRKLKLDEDLKPPWISNDGSIDEKARKKFFKSTWTRIRGGFDSDKYAALLQDIDRDIDKISKLTSAAIQLEPLRAEKKNRLQSMYWQSIRDQAQRLFESLSSRFSPCSCSYPHRANLRLDVRKGIGPDEAITRFAFLFTYEKALCGHSTLQALPWDYRDIEIESSQLANSQVTLSTAPSLTSAKKTARFAPTITVSSSTQSLSRSPSPSLATKIDNLCKALVDGYQSECCIGVLEDQHWQHHVYSVTGPGSNDQISEEASLKDIIYNSRAIAPRQKCTLALTLASSVLQLHDTPWLPRSWNTQDIYILKGHSGTTIPSQFYVSKTFTTPTAIKAANKRRRCVKNEMVFALGVALLELAHGSPILAFKQPDDLNEDGKEDSMTEVSIATRLAHEINNDESENYAKAVLRCITCSFDTFSYDFDDSEFREKFYEGVVVPLQQDYEFISGKI